MSPGPEETHASFVEPSQRTSEPHSSTRRPAACKSNYMFPWWLHRICHLLLRWLLFFSSSKTCPWVHLMTFKTVWMKYLSSFFSFQSNFAQIWKEIKHPDTACHFDNGSFFTDRETVLFLFMKRKNKKKWMESNLLSSLRLSLSLSLSQSHISASHHLVMLHCY